MILARCTLQSTTVYIVYLYHVLSENTRVCRIPNVFWFSSTAYGHVSYYISFIIVHYDAPNHNVHQP